MESWVSLPPYILQIGSESALIVKYYGGSKHYGFQCHSFFATKGNLGEFCLGEAMAEPEATVEQ